MRYWYDGGSAPWGMWVAMAVLMATLVVAAAWVIVTLVRHTTSHTPQSPGPSPGVPPPADAAAILDERFARGEIDPDEYTHRRELLRSTNSRSGG